MARLIVRTPSQVPTFKTSDGTIWENLQDATRHEAKLGLKQFILDNNKAYGEWDVEQIFEFLTEQASVLHDVLGMIKIDS